MVLLEEGLSVIAVVCNYLHNFPAFAGSYISFSLQFDHFLTASVNSLELSVHVSTQLLSLKQPVRSLANIVRRKNPGSLQKFLICATKGEN